MTSRDYLLLGLRNINTIIQAPRLLPLTFSKFIQDQDVFFSRMQGRTQGGSWGAQGAGNHGEEKKLFSFPSFPALALVTRYRARAILLTLSLPITFCAKKKYEKPVEEADEIPVCLPIVN